MANGRGEKGSATKRGFDNVTATPRKSTHSPLKKQGRKAPEEEEEIVPITIPADIKSEIMISINAALDSKLDEMTARLEAAMTTKLTELETKFQKILEGEIQKMKDEFNESIGHVEHVLKQDIDDTWEYAVRNEQYSRKNNLSQLKLTARVNCRLIRSLLSQPKMNKSSLVALSLGILVVSSYLCPVIHGKPAQPVPNNCCRLNLACCEAHREQAVELKSTILEELHDAGTEVEHPKALHMEEYYTRD
ncbi:hypothetical protein ACROYT_G024957 [Oculina patagonica]